MYNAVSKRLVKDSMIKSVGSKSLFMNMNRMSVNTKTLDDKEKGDERIFFTKQDGKISFINIITQNYWFRTSIERIN
jgi:hypothetical protein